MCLLSGITWETSKVRQDLGMMDASGPDIQSYRSSYWCVSSPSVQFLFLPLSCSSTHNHTISLSSSSHMWILSSFLSPLFLHHPPPPIPYSQASPSASPDTALFILHISHKIRTQFLYDITGIVSLRYILWWSISLFLMPLSYDEFALTE